MATALIGMGSNIDPKQHLLDAAQSMRDYFEVTCFSSVYISKAVGMDGDDFLNACCLLEHDLNYDVLHAWLKSLEDKHGRDRSKGSWKPRTLDLDILMFDEEVLDDDLYRYAHVFVPASELIQIIRPEDVKFAVVDRVEVQL